MNPAGTTPTTPPSNWSSLYDHIDPTWLLSDDDNDWTSMHDRVGATQNTNPGAAAPCHPDSHQKLPECTGPFALEALGRSQTLDAAITKFNCGETLSGTEQSMIAGLVAEEGFRCAE